MVQVFGALVKLATLVYRHGDAIQFYRIVDFGILKCFLERVSNTALPIRNRKGKKQDKH